MKLSAFLAGDFNLLNTLHVNWKLLPSYSDGMQVAEHSDHSSQSPGRQSAFSGQSQVGAAVVVVVVNEAAAPAAHKVPNIILLILPV